MYKIVRFYQRGERRTIETGLTLEQAQRHCNNPETSSTTARSSAARKRTRERGMWFDGYYKMALGIAAAGFLLVSSATPVSAERMKPARTITVKTVAAGTLKPGETVRITTADADSCVAWVESDDAARTGFDKCAERVETERRNAAKEGGAR
jgi:hypothetical protein